MTKSLIRNAAKNAPRRSGPIPFATKWNTNGGLYGAAQGDRFTQLSAMGMQGTLFAIIQLLSTGSQAYGPWHLYRKEQDGRVRYARHADKSPDQRREVVRHQALRLWNRPNDFMTGEQFREIGWQFMELVGEWYWVLNRGPSGTGIPIEMWPVRPDRMEPVPHSEKFLAGWVYTGPSGESVPLEVSEVIQIKYPNPLDPYRGLSAVQSVLSDIDAAKYTSEWTRNFFLNSAQPGGVVTFAKRLTDDEFNEFTARWREQHQGIARGHRVGVLEQGATWTPNNWTIKDLDLGTVRTNISDMIRQAYRIHQAMLGNSEDVNRANAETAEEVHVAWQEIPRLNRERGVLNSSYLEMFDAQDEVEFDYENPAPASANDVMEELQIKAAAAELMVAAGWDPAEVLQVVGFPPMKYTPPAKIQKPTGSPAETKPLDPAEHDGNPKTQPSEKPATPAAQPEPPHRHVSGLLEDLDESVFRDLGPMLREAFTVAKVNGHKKEEEVS